MPSDVTRLRPDNPSTSLLGLFFVGAGVMHFVKSSSYEAIVPPYVPGARQVVIVSGVAEIAGGVAVWVPSLRPYARWWLIALLVAVFPANVHMAVNPEDVRGLEVPRALLWARLPLQAVLVAWVVAGTQTPPRSRLPRLRARTATALRR